VRTQTETVLRQSLGEWIKPVLFLNKLDRAMIEQQLEPQELYVRLRAVVERVNAVIATYCGEQQSEAMGGLTVLFHFH
jgi:elongation factor 2